MPTPRSQRVQQALSRCPLYFILDESLCSSAAPTELAAAVLAGGVRMLQLRFKSPGSRELLGLARDLVGICQPRGCLLMINDRADIALLSGADGVHLGASDLPIADARRLGPELIIGATARSAQVARRAVKDGADCLGCGSVYPSATKGGLPLIGLAGLSRTAAAVGVPVTAIGGISLDSCSEVMQSGAAGFSAIAPFLNARSPRTLAQRFCRTGRRAVESAPHE